MNARNIIEYDIQVRGDTHDCCELTQFGESFGGDFLIVSLMKYEVNLCVVVLLIINRRLMFSRKILPMAHPSQISIGYLVRLCVFLFPHTLCNFCITTRQMSTAEESVIPTPPVLMNFRKQGGYLIVFTI